VYGAFDIMFSQLIGILVLIQCCFVVQTFGSRIRSRDYPDVDQRPGNNGIFTLLQFCDDCSFFNYLDQLF